MAFQFDDISVSHQLVVGCEFPTTVLGVGLAKIRGSSFIEGPSVFGDANTFPNIWATVMIGPTTNSDIIVPPLIPGVLCTGIHNPYSLAVQGPSAFMDTVDTAAGINVGTDVIAQGEVVSRCGIHWLSAKKDFDIPHPTKEGWRLTHACVEGPEASVYIRGRVKNKKEIDLPEYWKGLVDIDTITVNLTPIGSHQDVIVKRWDNEKVYLQSKGGMLIDCFYHIMAERIDTEKLIPEYEGTIEDYPGDNSQRSIVGYHYDIKR